MLEPKTTPACSSLALLNDLAIGGGAERVLSQLVNDAFAADDPLVLLFEIPKAQLPFKARTRALGVPLPPYGSFIREIRAVVKTCITLAIAKRAEGIKVCISHKEGPNFANVISGGSRTVVTVHEVKSSGMKFKGVKRALTRFLIRTLYNRANRVVTVSRGIADDLVTNFGVRRELIQVITNPCDVAKIQEMAAEAPPVGFERDPSRPTLISVGRLETPKGHWHLLRALARIRTQLPSVRLVIAGVGDHREMLDRMTRELGLEGCVLFAGFQPNPFSLMAAADVFVMSSLWEGFPLVLAEAMACGLPVVSTDCPTGAREVLSPGTSRPATPISAAQTVEYGILTPMLDGIYHDSRAPLTAAEQILADTCLKMLTEPVLREYYKQAGAKRIGDFTIGAFAAAWQKIARDQAR